MIPSTLQGSLAQSRTQGSVIVIEIRILWREDKYFWSSTDLWAELGYVNNSSFITSHSQLNREQPFVHPNISDWATFSNNPSASFSHSAFFSCCWLQNSTPQSGPHHVLHRLLRHHPLFMYPSLILPSENISLHRQCHAVLDQKKGGGNTKKPLLCNWKYSCIYIHCHNKLR